MLQYKIPQDVELADKILGPLTLKQLIILAVGGGLSYVLFLFISERYYLGIIDYFWIVIPLLISLAFAFVRLNDVSFLKWLMLLYEYGHNSRRRRWDKSETARLHFTFVTAKSGGDPAKKKDIKKSEIPGKKNFSSLEELAYVLDHGSKFSEKAEVVDDHEADYALHLGASKKDEHEKRLEDLIQNPLPKTAAPALSKSSNPSDGIASIDALSPQSVESVLPAANSVSEKAVDMVHQVSSSEQRITLEDLQRGGSVSFS